MSSVLRSVARAEKETSLFDVVLALKAPPMTTLLAIRITGPVFRAA
jgi:hypothetical protein